MKSWSQPLLLGVGFGATFLLGHHLPGLLRGPAVEAQGRGPVNPAPAPITAPQETPEAAPPIVYSEEGGQSASGNGFIAVTGSYGVGTSVLYLIDTQNRQLAVYEARGGSSEQRRVMLVGARRIDLDLQLHAYNDRSEYEYDELQELFQKRGRKDRDVKTGLEPEGRR
ncbi:MAG: hypothetical protein JNN13_16640 [Planctomycetes bacterium]|nr:hypothetical protein [Planctomycetota bacterium]MBZ0154122.1 hypothetical protein [Planctomycetota bacterium]MCC7398976.1 hypothetical protein [Planctomycetota bacterium]